MTLEEAKIEAARRWQLGTAWVVQRDPAHGHLPCRVGTQEEVLHLYGQGDDFEAAFLDATRMGH